jgi:hypothetical protein
VHRHSGPSPARQSGPEAHLDFVRGTPELDDADADAPLHAANECVLEKAGEPRRGDCTSLPALQLRTHSPDAARDASDGCRHQRARVVNRRDRRAAQRSRQKSGVAKAWTLVAKTGLRLQQPLLRLDLSVRSQDGIFQLLLREESEHDR